jgi:starch-binding outer membrane protein, SusD/RagB family
MTKTMNWAKYSLIIPLIVASGCGDFLSENPDNRVEIKTLKQAAQLLTNAYADGAYTFTEWMSDNVTFTTGTTRLPEHNQSYAWEDVISVEQDTPGNFWSSSYTAIAHANEILKIVDELPGNDEERDAVKGEALLTRAYAHFMLVNLFAKHYNEDDAEDDPGIPYVKEPETEFLKKYTRNTVEEVYDEVEDDLLTGLELVNSAFYANSGKYHFSRNAALALASRFYLFKGEFAKCSEYSSMMLGATPEVFLKDIGGLLEETVNPDDFIREYTSPAAQSNLLVIRQVTNFPVSVGYWPSPALIHGLYDSNPFGANDVRTSNEYPIYLRGSGWALAKYEFLFERTSLTSNVGLYYTIMPVFRGEEVLLNRAEAYVYQNKLTLAVADLQKLVNLRYDRDITLTTTMLRNWYGGSSAQALITFILDERQKEFMHEGLRWFDIKRYGIPVQHELEDGSTIELDNDDDRKVLQIPQAAIDVGGLEPNPR